MGMSGGKFQAVSVKDSGACLSGIRTCPAAGKRVLQGWTRDEGRNVGCGDTGGMLARTARKQEGQ